MKLIIAGTRTFDNYPLLKSKADELTANVTITEVVSGTNGKRDGEGNVTEGADLFGERWAEENNIPIKRFPADWDNFGKIAGPRRNEQMAMYGDALLAFRGPGESRGTDNMIKNAKACKLKARVVNY